MVCNLNRVVYGDELVLILYRCTVILAVTLSETLHLPIPKATSSSHSDKAQALYPISQSTLLYRSR